MPVIEPNPWEQPADRDAAAGFPPIVWTFIGLYWNAAWSVTALVFHTLPFAAFDLINDGGRTGRALWPLAPLGLLMMLLVALPATLIQVILLLTAFKHGSQFRWHRLRAVAVSMSAIGVFGLLAEWFRWFIHV